MSAVYIHLPAGPTIGTEKPYYITSKAQMRIALRPFLIILTFKTVLLSAATAGSGAEPKVVSQASMCKTAFKLDYEHSMDSIDSLNLVLYPLIISCAPEPLPEIVANKPFTAQYGLYSVTSE
jgi:hypothetical protein